MCRQIIVHNCSTQYSTDEFRQSSLLSSKQSSLLKCCLLVGERQLSHRLACSSSHVRSARCQITTVYQKKTFNKQTFPALSHAIWQRILDVETSFDLGNPVKTFTGVCSSMSHTRTEPSHDEEA